MKSSRSYRVLKYLEISLTPDCRKRTRSNFDLKMMKFLDYVPALKVILRKLPQLHKLGEVVQQIRQKSAPSKFEFNLIKFLRLCFAFHNYTYMKDQKTGIRERTLKVRFLRMMGVEKAKVASYIDQRMKSHKISELEVIVYPRESAVYQYSVLQKVQGESAPHTHTMFQHVRNTVRSWMEHIGEGPENTSFLSIRR